MTSQTNLAKVLMVQGTTSSAGKSLLVTALCRIFVRRGWRVAPFKAQNMSNNAAVCADGSEIGRAQFTQAQAAEIAPSALMNPILLKPEADSRSQVVVLGRPSETLAARDYYSRKQMLWQYVRESLDTLRTQVDLVIIEGAGSPVELNLKQGDIVNMAVAKYAQAPVLLVGDIDRGGVFAQLLGTLWLLDEDERDLVKGMIVNKFRGDVTLFEEGLSILEEKGSVPVLGIVPYINHSLPEEDAVTIEPQNTTTASSTGEINIVIIRLPRIANFDDFDPLAREIGVSVRYVSTLAEIGSPDAIIIPGTKATIADLQWLKHVGLADVIIRFAKEDGIVVGICGGYQMLGEVIIDRHNVESRQSASRGLALLPIQTEFEGIKSTYQVEAKVIGTGCWFDDVGTSLLTGYEIHMGQTLPYKPWLQLTRDDNIVLDGSSSKNGRVWGCYVHGLFDNTHLRRAWLQSLGWAGSANNAIPTGNPFDVVADAVETALDVDYIEQLLAEQ